MTWRIDLHADTPYWMRQFGYDFFRRHTPMLPRSAWFGHADLPRLVEAGIQVQLFGLVALPMDLTPYRTILDTIAVIEQTAADSGGRVRVARNWAQIEAARADGALATMLTLEGVHPLEGQLERAEALLDRGVVSIGLSHFHHNAAARPAMGLGARANSPLTAFGRDVVRLLAERGALLDLTHVNRAGFFDAIRTSTGAVFVSHTGICAAYPHRRNLEDDQVRAIADRGGVIGLMSARRYLGGPGIEAMIHTLRQLIRVGGEQVAALGSDFDGLVTPVAGFDQISRLPQLIDALHRAGFRARVIDDFVGDNAARLLRRVLGQGLLTPSLGAVQ